MDAQICLLRCVVPVQARLIVRLLVKHSPLRQCDSAIRCRIMPYLIKAAPRGAAGLASARGSALAARPPHAGPHRQVLQLKMPLRADQCVAWSSFSASNCPVLRHRVNGGPGGCRKRPVTRSIDLVAAHEGLAPVRKTKTDREDNSARPYFRARRDGGILRSRDNAT